MTTPQPATKARSYPTASLAVQAQLAASFYAAQALLAAWAIRDILAIWNQLHLRDVRSSWPAIRTALASLIESRFGMSAAQATAYYAQARMAAGVTGPPPMVSIPPPSTALVTATLDSTGPYALLGRIKQAQPLETAMENTSVVMSGAASRLIQSGARDTVLTLVRDDSEAVGWMRVLGGPRPNCSFCSMLASRGVAFKTKKSAMAYWHNLCQCQPMPVYSAEDAEALRDNDLYQQWKQVTRGYHKQDALNAWRRYWDAKQNRDGIRVLPAA